MTRKLRWNATLIDLTPRFKPRQAPSTDTESTLLFRKCRWKLRAGVSMKGHASVRSLELSRAKARRGGRSKRKCAVSEAAPYSTLYRSVG